MTRLHSFEAAASQLGISTRTLARRLRDGGNAPRVTRIGKYNRFTDEALETYKASCQA
jgi:hypothetical protein